MVTYLTTTVIFTTLQVQPELAKLRNLHPKPRHTKRPNPQTNSSVVEWLVFRVWRFRNFGFGVYGFKKSLVVLGSWQESESSPPWMRLLLIRMARTFAGIQALGALGFRALGALGV